MTPADKREMRERKRLAYRRRLQAIREDKDLPRLTNRQRTALLDLCMSVQGDGITDPDLYVLHRLASRGLCG